MKSPIIWVGFVFFLTVSLSLCIHVLRFDDPKDIPLSKLKIGNITDDNYEVVLNVPEVSFPLGRDWTMCYRWFIDQTRYTDSGKFTLRLKLYMNESDSNGADHTIIMEPRGFPQLWGLGLDYHKHWKSSLDDTYPWMKNLMASELHIQPQHWRSICHIVDLGKKTMTLIIDGEKLLSMEIINPSEHMIDYKQDWPKAKLLNITFGPKLNMVSTGYSIGTFTDLNIFSDNIGEETVMNITGSLTQTNNLTIDFILNPIQGGGVKTPTLHFFIKLLKEGNIK